jgi:hypothetical protein
LDILRRSGLEKVALTLGYEPFYPLDAGAYTPFQSKLDRLISKGTIHRAAVDSDLFGYAFNKSNIDASQFNFRQYEWRDNTRIERSSFYDVRLEQLIFDAAEESAARINGVFHEVLCMPCESEQQTLAQISCIRSDNMSTLRPHLPARYDAAFAQAQDAVRNAFGADEVGRITDRRPPLLLYSIGHYNLVAHRGQFFAIPQSLGPIDLEREDVIGKPGAMVATDLHDLEARLGAVMEIPSQ